MNLSLPNVQLQTANNNFQNPNNNNLPNGKKFRRFKFSFEEDEELKRLVSKHSKDWKKVSEEMHKACLGPTNRSPKQCKDRYLNYLSPEISHNEWTPEEDHFLEIQQFFNLHQWKKIKNFFPNRSEVEIKNRFNYIHNRHLKILKPQIEQNIKNSSNEIHQENGLKQTFSEPNNDFLSKKLPLFEKLFKKYNKNSQFNSSNINSCDLNSLPNISKETAKMLLVAAKDKELKNKMEYVKEEVSTLSSLIETRSFIDYNFNLSEFSDFDPFMFNS